MDRTTLLKIMKNLLIALVTALVVLIYLEFAKGIRVPGLAPFVLAAYFFVLWRYNVLRECHPGGLWTVPYIVVIALEVIVGCVQIMRAVR